MFTRSEESATATISTEKSGWPEKSRISRWSFGASWMQGGHQVAQKWTRVTGARRCPIVAARPAES